MASLDVLRSWGGTDDAFEVGAIRGADGAFEAELALRAAPGGSAILSQRTGSAAMELALLVDIPVDLTKLGAQGSEVAASLRELADDMEVRRSGMVACALRTERLVPAIQVTATIFEDGFSRHVLNAVAAECAKARRQIEQGFLRILALHAAEAQYSRAMKELDAAMKESPPRTDGDTPKPRPPKPPKPAAAAQPLKTAVELATESHAPAPSPRACPNPACRKPVAAGKKFCTTCGTRIE